MTSNKKYIIIAIIIAIIMITLVVILPSVYSMPYFSTSSETSYDNSNTWLTSTTVQGALDELYNQKYGCPNGQICLKSPYVYTANINIYDKNTQVWKYVCLGQPISNSITTYSTPDAAMTALETAYSTLNNGATATLPFFLRHRLTNDTVTESYVGFVVTPQMASDNPGMTAGTYYLRGDNMWEYDSTNNSWNCKSEFIDPGTGDCMTSQYYNANKAVLQSAFGTNNNYCFDYSSDFGCYVPGLRAEAYSDGFVGAIDDAGSGCEVDNGGRSSCCVHVGGGG